MNNKSPLELCPCSVVAGDAVHSNLGMQCVVCGKEHKLWGLDTSLRRSGKM